MQLQTVTPKERDINTSKPKKKQSCNVFMRKLRTGSNELYDCSSENRRWRHKNAC